MALALTMEDHFRDKISTDERFLRVKEVYRFLRDKVEYDYDAINSENGKINDKTPEEVVKSRKATCMGGVFYASRELREDLDEEMISIFPIVRNHGGSLDSWGVFHGMYLFNIDGLYGAVSKSRERLLEFVPPKHLTIRSLVLSENLLRGFSRINKTRGKELRGIGFLDHEIREIHPDYDFDVTKTPIKNLAKIMKRVMF